MELWMIGITILITVCFVGIAIGIIKSNKKIWAIAILGLLAALLFMGGIWFYLLSK